MKTKSDVYLLEISSYDEEIIYRNLKWALEQMGGLDDILEGVSKKSRILLKPNLVRKAEVDRAVITHPAVMTALARILSENGYENVRAGDSCGYGSAKKAMEGTGMDTGLQKYGVEVCDFESGTKTDIQGNKAKTMMMCDEVLQADAVINVCKMKTHALERITGAVKNIYGTVYALYKAKGHTQYPDANSFADMIVDLNLFVKPRLHIMDGITAMEGNGPTSGDPVEMHVLLVSKDPVAIDTVFCHLIHLKPEMVPTNVFGEKKGLGTCHMDQINLITPKGRISMDDAVKLYGRADFNVDRKALRQYAVWIRFLKVFKIFKMFQKRPYIDRDKCIRCGICVESCPVEGKAVNFIHGRKEIPVYDYQKCIRCFCCQEMCPNKAIQVK